MLYSANAPQSVLITGVPESMASICTPQKGSRKIDGASTALARENSRRRSSGPTVPSMVANSAGSVSISLPV